MKKVKFTPKLSKLSFDKKVILSLAESDYMGGAHTNTGLLSCVNPTAPAPAPFSRASCDFMCTIGTTPQTTPGVNCILSVSPHRC